MAAPRRFDLEDAVNRPGTYYHPATEMLLVVDDSAAVDSEVFQGIEYEENEWVLVSDTAPIEEAVRDHVIERFETRHHPGATGAVAATEDDEGEDDEVLEPDEEEDDGVEELDPYGGGGFGDDEEEEY